MDELLQFLESIHPMSDDLKTYLQDTVKGRQFKKKEYLLTAGQVSRHACFIMKGLLRCFYEKGNIDVSSWFMKEGDVVFAIKSFHSQTPSYESIQALEDTFIYYISYEELEYIYERYPEFNYTGRKLTTQYHQLWDQQLYSTRMCSGKERYQLFLANHADLVQRVPAKYLASYLGITEVQLSRIRRQILY